MTHGTVGVAMEQATSAILLAAIAGQKAGVVLVGVALHISLRFVVCGRVLATERPDRASLRIATLALLLHYLNSKLRSNYRTKKYLIHIH